ncbi:MAG: SCP2 sterol-binding domain-containing protein [Alphaproteobacteria bacterium]|nr:SCP2 sterol-binding domain-containing protein [Alphaproteobacteria bacterium]
MDSSSLPIPLAQALMSVMPAAVLERSIDVVLRRMRMRFPKLFKNLSELQSATIILKPSDLPHQFMIKIGCNPVTFSVVSGEDYPADARVTGSLESLVDMLEGRADGDMLFFSRDIQVTGDTSIIVALRNTLDREEIDLFAEITGLCGPFAPVMRSALAYADRFAQRILGHIRAVHEEKSRKEKVPAV